MIPSIDRRLEEALKSVGISELTDLQNRAFEVVYSGKNTIVMAPTGSGKTEAVMIPIFQKLLERKMPGICVLYITPLRALNRDMLRRMKKIAEMLKISIDVRHGDTKEGERVKQSKKPPEILITTPETFQILFLGRKLREALRNVKFLVIDEIHELIDSERGVQLFVGIERLREIAKFQLIALSATISDPKRVSEILGGAEIVSGEIEKEYEIRILSSEDELSLIKELVEKNGPTLIFVNTRQTAEVIGVHLKKLLDVEVHHGSLSREARISAEENFASGKLKALICTSSMELGIDIGHVNAVIQYSSPRQAIRLIQRVGRSGHGLGRKSVGYIIANTFDDIVESIAIMDRVKVGKLEDLELHENSLDVLANQICAIAIEYGRISAKKTYEIVKRCYFYRNLSYEEFSEICNYLKEIWRIFYDGEEISARRRTRKYFYDNISMIMDEKSLKVVDITSGKAIGNLDESFLSTFGGEVFAMKGELWRILSVENVVKVEPAVSEGEIPSWVGEEIPVPFEVAQLVGKLRRLIADGKIGIEDLKNLVDENGVKKVLEKIEEQKKDFEIPSDDHVIIDGSGRDVVVNVCFGHKANEAIGRILALILSLKKGTNVSVEIDPYRIKISPASPEEVKEAILSVNPEEVWNLAERAIIETRLMQWKIVKSARKFGVLEKDEDLSRINLRTLVLKLLGTPVYKEALREIFLEKMDLEKAKLFFEKFSKEIKFSVYDKFTPISLEGRDKVPDLLITKPSGAILKAFMERIKGEMCKVICINCGASYREIAKNLNLKCVKCGSFMIAVLSDRKNYEPNREELFKIANLIMNYRMKGVYAMLTYGVGFETAKRVLSGYYNSEEEFFKALLEAERKYVRTRKFWD
ncbi:MAG: DEAD/DEAH box helicase [Archaeoglobaceae archaeon]|nr:DEAD/DEAH box helicase [Archaeoglobaceae archaeon]MDW8127643.1 DEAD/DEAH box helicase [Archaeoglobaceae archaeon]